MYPRHWSTARLIDVALLALDDTPGVPPSQVWSVGTSEPTVLRGPFPQQTGTCNPRQPSERSHHVGQSALRSACCESGRAGYFGGIPVELVGLEDLPCRPESIESA